MVLPLLGILGLGAALAAKPAYDSWSEDRAMQGRARRAQGLPPASLLGGLLGRGGGADPEPFNDDLFIKDADGGRSWMVDPSITPFDYNAQLIRSGLLAPEPLTDPYGIAELGEWGANQRQAQSDAAAMARVNAGEAGAMDRLRYGEGAAMDRLIYDTQNRPVEPVQPLFSYGGNPQSFATEVDKYNRFDQAIASADEAWQFVSNTVLEGGVWNNDTRERLRAQLATSALPMLAQEVMQAGAMSDEEAPMFKAMAGMELDKIGDSKVLAAIEAVIDRAQEMQTSRFGTFVNSDIGGGASGEALAERLGAFGIRPPRQTRFYRRRRDERELEGVPEFGSGGR